jgi:transcriptional regulator with XRE-family HTH domain
MAVAEKVNNYINEQGLKKSRLAERIGVSKPSLYAKLSGRRRLDAETLIKLATALNVSVEELTQ